MNLILVMLFTCGISLNNTSDSCKCASLVTKGKLKLSLSGSQLFTGVCVDIDSIDNIVYRSSNYKAGILHGKQVEYYINYPDSVDGEMLEPTIGGILSESNYEEGLLHGKSYLFGNEGDTIETVLMNNGKFISVIKHIRDE